MKNKLSDLNDHLFAQLERLSDEDLDAEALSKEIDRSKAISAIAKDITANATVVLNAHKLALDYGLKPKAPEFIGLEMKP